MFTDRQGVGAVVAELNIEKRGDVLHVEAIGTRTLEAVESIVVQIMEAANKHETTKVIVDVRKLKGRLATWDAYKIPSTQFPKLGDRQTIQKAAIVDLKEFEDQYRFFENVAVNRGYFLRIFGGLDEAMEWIE